MFVPNLPSVAKRKRAVDEHEHEEHSPTKLVPRRDSILKSEVKPSVRANIEHDDQELSGDEEPEEEQQRISIRDLMKNTRTGKPTKAALERIEKRKVERQKKKETKKRSDEEEEQSVEEPSVASTRSTGVKVEAPPQEEQHAAAFAPSVQIVDGKIVINPDSLTVLTTQVGIDQLNDVSKWQVVPDEQRYITSASYRTRTPSEKWSDAETAQFYNALRQCGTDFSLIEKFFPTRSRRQIRNKFKKEERDSPHRIDYALKHKLPLDVKMFQRMAGLDEEDAPIEPQSTAQESNADNNTNVQHTDVAE
jgi:transcription factor TFIIIB component B''